MARLNLKTDKPLSLSSSDEEGKREKDYSLVAEVHEEIEENDDTFSSVESLLEKTEPNPEPSAEPFVSEAQEPAKQEKVVPPKPSYLYEESGFDSFKSKFSGNKLYYYFAGAGLLLLLVIFLLFKLFTGGAEVAETPKPVQQPAVSGETKAPVSGTGNVISLPIFQENYSANKFLQSTVGNLFSKKPATIDYSLLVITPNDINLSVTGNSKNRVVNSAAVLNKITPNVAFKVISSRGSSPGKFSGDLVGRIKQTKAFAAKISNPRTVQQKDFNNVLKALAKKNNITVKKLVVGKASNQRNYREAPFYADLGGKRDNLVHLLSELVETYPMVRITKFSIYPYNLGTISSSNLSAKLNFTYYTAK